MKTIVSFTVAAALLVAPLMAAAQIDDAKFAELIEKYFETERGREKLGTAVESYFKKRQDQARKQQEDRLAAEMEDQFKNPVKIEVGASPVKGPADAKVTIVEFSDFQCPYCKRGKDTVEELLKKYPKDVKVTFKNLPLPFHNQAMPAAKAALAAGRQGKFWEMHDKLFDNQSKLSDAFYDQAAKDLGLNVEKFKKDMADPAIEKMIKDDMEIAKQHNIQGTPGFFVGGVAVRGAYPVEHFSKIIDRILEKPAT